MQPFRRLRYKTRIGMLLGVLMLSLLLNNLASRASIERMERTANSVYADRLMPSTFIFELREHLERSRALAASPPDRNARLLREREQHRLAIAELIRKYEQTVLTDEERAEWKAFKLHLRQFQASQAGADAHFEQTLKSLNHLSHIQAGEGKHLQANMHALVNASALRSYLEIAIIIAIGGITLALIGFSKGAFEQGPPRRPSLN